MQRLEHLAERGHTALEPGLEAGPEVRADVEDDAVRLDRARGVDGGAHRLEALAEDGLVGRGQVAEVQRMHEHRADARLGALLTEAGEVFLRVYREAPRTRALGEELHRVGPDLDARCRAPV